MSSRLWLFENRRLIKDEPADTGELFQGGESHDRSIRVRDQGDRPIDGFDDGSQIGPFVRQGIARSVAALAGAAAIEDIRREMPAERWLH